MTTLEYYFEDGSHVIFNKYTIDTSGIVRKKKTGDQLSTHKVGKYNRCGVVDDNDKQRMVSIGRALASTYIGPPPTLKHTVDHEDKNSNNDTCENIRWLCKKGQRYNQERPETQKSAFVIVKDGNEKTIKEWVEYLKDRKNHLKHEYTANMIRDYSNRKQHGFSHKIYLDLPGEVWKEIVGSKNKTGRWEISNMSRVKYITKHAENMLSGERLRLTDNGYPTIFINGKNMYCHILAFKTFFPEEYAFKKPGEIVKHIGDNKLDFSPHKLQLGTHSENQLESHDNGKRDGTKTRRTKCASYINGVLEKEHLSQTDAAKYLKSVGFDKASYTGIGNALKGKFAYGRTWQKI
jgi:hypothetical protein